MAEASRLRPEGERGLLTLKDRVTLLGWLSLPPVFLVMGFRSLYLFPSSYGFEVGLGGFAVLVPVTILTLLKAKGELDKATAGFDAGWLLFSVVRGIGILASLADLSAVIVLRRGFTEYLAGGGLIRVEAIQVLFIPPIAFAVFFAFCFAYLALFRKPDGMATGLILYAVVMVISVLWNPGASQIS